MLRNIVKLNVFLPKKLSCQSSVRFFSGDSDSHDDFKPKVKSVVAEGLSDVMKLVAKQTTENPVMLYMKGTPNSPQCGFSGKVVGILNAVGVEFSSVNILQYPAIREAVKQYSDWPTLPQLYIAGEFVGGCDIVSEMYKSGELKTLLTEKKLLSK